jgi:hypothetical protein
MTSYTIIGLGLLGWLSEPLTVSSPATPAPAKAQYYQVRVFRQKDAAAAPVVYGKIYGFEQQQPLPKSVLRIGKRIIWTDAAGAFYLQLAPGRYAFRARNISYDEVVTRHLHVRPGDSLEFFFRLPAAPPISCQ